MNAILQKLKTGAWRSWVNPVLMVLTLYLLFRVLITNEPLFNTVVPHVPRGEVPEVSFNPSRTFYASLTLFVLFNVFMFQALRQWARYYLNRKLVLSYLLFAIIPLVTNVFIISTGVVTWLGISTTYVVERVIDRQSAELDEFIRELHEACENESRRGSMDTAKARMITNRHVRNANLKYLRPESVRINMLLLTEKMTGQLRTMVPYHIPDDVDLPRRILMENMPEFGWFWPDWHEEGEQWTDIVNDNGDLFIRHISTTPARYGDLVITASVPVDREFLNRLREFQNMRLTISDYDGSRFISSDTTPAAWYTRLLLKPLSNKRNILALNWEQGLYEEYGRMTFEVEPGEISRILDYNRDIHIFIGDEQKSALRFIIFMSVLLGLGVLVAIIFGIYLITYITRSLNTIADGHERVKDGDLNYRLPHIGKDQLGSMGRSFNGMVNSIQTLMTQVAETEKYQEELRIARDIQMSLLPDLQSLEWVSNIAATCIPAREVGGDYYEVLQADFGEIGVFIADVSGKGAAAAFYMAELKGVLIALKHLWNDPKELMLGMNEILQPALASNVFISAAYLLLDPLARSGKLARAGHCPSYLVHTNGDVEELMPPGMALGISKNNVFGKIIKVQHFDIQPGEKVILYTDGLDEMTHENQMYGSQKLIEVLKENCGLGVEQLKDAILDDVLTFLSDDVQNDDLTLVVAALPDSKESASKEDHAKSNADVLTS